MKYYIWDKFGFKRLYAEESSISIRYSVKDGKWVDGGLELMDARVGFDPSEPEDSPYRYGNDLGDIIEITKKEAEEFISKEIDEKEIKKLLLRS